jgi:hypothetical protein
MHCITSLASFAAILILSLSCTGSGSVWAASAKKSAGSTTAGTECVWTFHSYESSAWEKEWINGEETGKRKDLECEVLAEKEEVERSVRLIRAVTAVVLDSATSLPADSIPLFSRMIYARRCGPNKVDTGRRRAQLIEPLVGILRDPLTMCPRPPNVSREIYGAFGPLESNEQSKRHLLPAPLAPWSDTPDDPKSWRVGGIDDTWTPGTPARQKVLMDIGASLYGGWHSNAFAVGASWFVERFKRHSLAFDWIVSFEIEKHDPDEIYKDVPDDVLPHYLYFNQGVVAQAGARWNPWRILKEMNVSKQDYVAVKLDIDVPEIEDSLTDELKNDETLRQFVDDFFFEHHVNVKAMNRSWHTENLSVTMKDSYRLFLALRAKGVRMHGWP